MMGSKGSKPRTPGSLLLVGLGLAVSCASWVSCQWRTSGAVSETEGPSGPQDTLAWPPQCPVAEVICPMIYDPVRCTLRQGDVALLSVQAGNECQALAKLKEAWCLEHKESAQKPEGDLRDLPFTLSCVRAEEPAP
jgi:hypothetical protein